MGNTFDIENTTLECYKQQKGTPYIPHSKGRLPHCEYCVMYMHSVLKACTDKIIVKLHAVEKYTQLQYSVPIAMHYRFCGRICYNL